MKGVKHKTRLELIRNNNIVSTIEPVMDSGNDDLKISTSSSIHSFPTLTFKSLNSELNQVFMGYSKGDIVRLSVSNDVDEKYITLFEGEFFRKETKFESEPTSLILNVEAIHSFFRLSLLEISSQIEFKEIAFKDFILEILKLSGINMEVNIEPDIAMIPIIGISKRTNIFRLFKEVCMMIDASVVFNTNNTVNIESRLSRINHFRYREITNISDKDIISFESMDKI